MNNKTDYIFAVCLTLLLTIIGALTVVFVIAMYNVVGSIQDTQSKVDTVYVTTHDTIYINYEKNQEHN